MQRIEQMLNEQRAQRYRLLRDYFHNASDNEEDSDSDDFLQTVTLAERTKVLDKKLVQVYALLAQYQVRVMAVRAANGSALELEDDLRMQVGMTLVLAGNQRDLSEAEDFLSQ